MIKSKLSSHTLTFPLEKFIIYPFLLIVCRQLFVSHERRGLFMKRMKNESIQKTSNNQIRGNVVIFAGSERGVGMHNTFKANQCIKH